MVPGPRRIDITIPRPSARSQPPGLWLRWPQLTDEDCAIVTGVHCTTAARAVVDIARSPASRRSAVILADAALHARLVTIDELVAAARRIAHPAQRRVALLALAQADGESRSPRETRVRLILQDAGLPLPVSNWPLQDRYGSIIALGDLVYDLLLIWIEYDGFATHSSPAAFRADRIRERRIREYGFDVLRLVDDDVQRPARLAGNVADLMAAAPARIASLNPAMSPYVARARDALGLTV